MGYDEAFVPFAVAAITPLGCAWVASRFVPPTNKWIYGSVIIGSAYLSWKYIVPRMLTSMGYPVPFEAESFSADEEEIFRHKQQIIAKMMRDAPACESCGNLKTYTPTEYNRYTCWSCKDDPSWGAESFNAESGDMERYMNMAWKKYTPREKMDMQLMDLHYGHSNKNTKRHFKKGYEYGWKLAREKAPNGAPLYRVARAKDLITTSLRKDGFLVDAGAYAGFDDSWRVYEGELNAESHDFSQKSAESFAAEPCEHDWEYVGSYGTSFWSGYADEAVEVEVGMAEYRCKNCRRTKEVEIKEDYDAESKFIRPYDRKGKIDFRRDNKGRYRRKLSIPLKKNAEGDIRNIFRIADHYEMQARWARNVVDRAITKGCFSDELVETLQDEADELGMSVGSRISR